MKTDENMPELTARPDASYTEEGYPTEESLDAVRTFRGTAREFAEYAAELCQGGFASIEEGADASGDPVHVLRIVTGGWSGVESLIGVIDRTMFGVMFFELRRRGGLHEWNIPPHLWDAEPISWALATQSAGSREQKPQSWLTREWVPPFEQRVIRALARAPYRPLAPADGFPKWQAARDLVLTQLRSGTRVRPGVTITATLLHVLDQSEVADTALRDDVARRSTPGYVSPAAFFAISGVILVIATAGTMSDLLPLKVLANVTLAAATAVVGYLLLGRGRH